MLKSAVFDDLLAAMRAVAADAMYVSPEIKDVVLRDYLDHLAKAQQPRSPLTTREREVLQLLAEGYSMHDIAAKLHVSANTAGTHRNDIMQKLGIRTLPELTKYALREGIATLDSD